MSVDVITELLYTLRRLSDYHLDFELNSKE